MNSQVSYHIFRLFILSTAAVAAMLGVQVCSGSNSRNLRECKQVFRWPGWSGSDQGADPGKVHNPQRRRAKHPRSRCRGTDRRNQRDRRLGHGDCQSDSQQLKVVTPLLKSQLLQKPPCNLMSHVARQTMCLSKLSY